MCTLITIPRITPEYRIVNCFIFIYRKNNKIFGETTYYSPDFLLIIHFIKFLEKYKIVLTRILSCVILITSLSVHEHATETRKQKNGGQKQ